jgi:16S rRNA (cytidine1402-2'-O)-methyltransferase
MNTGILYIVATPIGNLEDITLRALRILKEVDYILCEDTRVTKKLLDHFQVNKPTISYHHHSDQKKVQEIQSLLEVGRNIALVTDAGTPGISDPGNILISDLVRNIPAITINPIPGPSAVIAALSISGFPTDKFVFLGFPPHKNKRQKFFQELKELQHTAVFFESTHRIKKCLGELKEVLESTREIIVCRELTKKFETIYRGTIDQVTNQLTEERGEFVVVINGM